MTPGTRLNILMRLLRNFKLLAPLIRDYWKGSYRKVSVFSLLVFFLSLVYILSPIDLIPDYLLGLGQMDDLAVLGAGLYLLERDLLKYDQWRLQRKG